MILQLGIDCKGRLFFIGLHDMRVYMPYITRPKYGTARLSLIPTKNLFYKFVYWSGNW